MYDGRGAHCRHRDAMMPHDARQPDHGIIANPSKALAAAIEPISMDASGRVRKADKSVEKAVTTHKNHETNEVKIHRTLPHEVSRPPLRLSSMNRSAGIPQDFIMVTSSEVPPSPRDSVAKLGRAQCKLAGLRDARGCRQQQA